jgi:hypothetical protein
MIEIELTGLTKRQKILADIIWQIDDWNDVQTFIRSLPKRDQIDCEGIVECMRMSLVEQYAKAMKEDGYIDESNSEANALIQKVKQKK